MGNFLSSSVKIMASVYVKVSLLNTVVYAKVCPQVWPWKLCVKQLHSKSTWLQCLVAHPLNKCEELTTMSTKQPITFLFYSEVYHKTLWWSHSDFHNKESNHHIWKQDKDQQNHIIECSKESQLCDIIGKLNSCSCSQHGQTWVYRGDKRLKYMKIFCDHYI